MKWSIGRTAGFGRWFSVAQWSRLAQDWWSCAVTLFCLSNNSDVEVIGSVLQSWGGHRKSQQYVSNFLLLLHTHYMFRPVRPIFRILGAIYATTDPSLLFKLSIVYIYIYIYIFIYLFISFFVLAIFSPLCSGCDCNSRHNRMEPSKIKKKIKNKDRCY
jgi:hypothetical protein